MYTNVRIKGRDGCRLYFQEGKALCRVGTEKDDKVVMLFPVAAASRLMMDKSASTRVRIILEGQNQPFLDVQFGKEGDRERFANELRQQRVTIKSEAGVAQQQVEGKVSSSLMASTRPSLTDHLDGLFTSADRRGTLSLFQVLDDLVDTSAITEGSRGVCLRPLTDQMIADVFAAVPSLAAAHEILVTRKGLAEQDFWSAVVGKYLCFKATPLDSLVGNPPTEPLSGANSTDAFLRYVNTASSIPLRKAGFKRQRTNIEEDVGARPNESITRLSLYYRRCVQPTEVPMSLSNSMSMPACNEILISNQQDLQSFATSSPKQISVGFDVQQAWIRYWQALDASDFSLAEARYAEAASLDQNRPHVARRALEVLKACKEN